MTVTLLDVSGSVALRLRDLPPVTGDAELAALLLLDLAVVIAAPPRHAAAAPEAIVLDGDTLSDRTVVTDGQLFRFVDSVRVEPDAARLAAATYSAAELALTRYLGRSPWSARTSTASSPAGLAAGRSAMGRPSVGGSAAGRSSAGGSAAGRSAAGSRRTFPAHFGQLPDPFRSVFVHALSSRPLFRLAPADVATALAHAFELAGSDALAQARGRLARATTLGRAFIPAEPTRPLGEATATTGFAPSSASPAPSRSALPAPTDRIIRTAPPGRRADRRGQLRRIVLVGAVFVVVAGGATAAVAAVRNGSPSGVLPPAPARSTAQPIVDASSRTPGPSATASVTAAAPTTSVSTAGPHVEPTTPTTSPARVSSKRPAAATPTPAATPSVSTESSAAAPPPVESPTAAPSTDPAPVAGPTTPSDAASAPTPTFPVAPS